MQENGEKVNRLLMSGTIDTSIVTWQDESSRGQ